jgi:sugar transferase (PEP-CTERM system associated)
MYGHQRQWSLVDGQSNVETVGNWRVIKIFNHYLHRRTLFQVFFDLGLVVAAVIMSMMWQVNDVALSLSVAITCAFLLALGMLAINSGLGFYQRVHNRSVGQSRSRAVLSLVMTLGLAYAIFSLLPMHLVDRQLFAIMVSTCIVMVLVHRIYVAHSSSQSLVRQRILVFGTGTRARLVGRSLKKSDPNVDLVGYFAGPNEVITEVSAWGVLTPDKSLTDIVVDEQVDEIVVALAERRGGSMPLRELLDCKLHGVRVVDIATHFEKTLGQIRLDSVNPGWLIFGDGFDQGVVRTLVKRLFDIVFATVLVILSAPIMLITGILILLESGGPMLYLQERVGLNGRLFSVVKFRSMRTDAEKDGTPRWAAAQDDRVTRVGRIIRKLRIDELPQLFTVLAGDMSLVGPRPERPVFIQKFRRRIPRYQLRHMVKAGMTGWAQIHGLRGRTSIEKRVEYDLYYIEHWSLLLDLKILARTVAFGFLSRNAY